MQAIKRPAPPASTPPAFAFVSYAAAATSAPGAALGAAPGAAQPPAQLPRRRSRGALDVL